MFELITIFFHFALIQIFSISFSLIRAKTLASICGVACFGLVSQASMLILSLQVMFGAGLGSGFIKLIAENLTKENTDRLNQILSTTYYVGSLISVLGATFISLFSPRVSTWVFGDARYTGYLIICAWAVFFIFQNTFFLNLIRGLLEWRLYTRTVNISYVLNTIITVLLVFRFGISGGIWALLVAQIGIMFLMLIILAKKIFPDYPVIFWKTRPAREALDLLVNNIGLIVVAQIVLVFGNLAVRSLLVGSLGAEKNGIYQVASGVSDTYLTPILGILVSYILPKIVTLNRMDSSGARKIQDDGLRLSVLAVTPILILLLALHEVWIPILYSREFLAAGNILAWQFIGDFFYIVRICFNVDLIPNNRFRFYLLDSIVFSAGSIILVSSLLSRLDITAIAITRLAMNAALVLLSFGYHRSKALFQLSRGSKRLLLKALAFLGVGFPCIMGVHNLAARLVFTAILLSLMAWKLPQKGDYRRLKLEILKISRQRDTAVLDIRLSR